MKTPRKNEIRILFFIGHLSVGGKERRLVELLSYLRRYKNHELLVVTTESDVEFSKFLELDIKKITLKKSKIISKFNYFFDFNKVLKNFKPHIVHTWGSMQTLYSLPTVMYSEIKLINGQITSAPPHVPLKEQLINSINFLYSDLILSNSKAGIEAFKPPKSKARVIYNGLNLSRFENLPDISLIKEKYRIKTRYLIVMVANFTPNKDYLRFFRIANLLCKERNDVTCMGVGYFEKDSELVSGCRKIIGTNKNLIIHPQITDVEALINACDIGILFSPNGEGISNAIIEYMALGKPVIANDAGGTKEIINHNENGYLIRNQSEEDIKDLLLNLLDNEKERISFGLASRMRIERDFSLSMMGNAFSDIYQEILNHH